MELPSAKDLPLQVKSVPEKRFQGFRISSSLLSAKLEYAIDNQRHTALTMRLPTWGFYTALPGAAPAPSL